MNSFILTQETADVVLARALKFVDKMLEGGAVEIDVKRFRKTRSNQQNRALFGLAYKLLSEHTGYEAGEIHEYLCGEYWGWVEHELFGKKKHRPRRTTTTDEDGKASTLDTEQFAEFFDFVQRFAAEKCGLYIPDPDPDWKEQAA